MELEPIYRCVAALEVHQAKLTVCVLYEDDAGETRVELREFGGFKRDRRAMAEWVASFNPQQVVMESTGIVSDIHGKSARAIIKLRKYDLGVDAACRTVRIYPALH